MKGIIAMLLTLFLLSAIDAFACIYFETQVPPSFYVRVQSGNGDVPGVHVLLAGKKRYEVMTDARGRARFEHVAFGHYSVVAGASVDSLDVVDSAEANGGTFTLHYKDPRLLRVQTLDGAFINEPEGRVRLTALSANDQPLGSVEIGKHRDFDLSKYANAIASVMVEIERDGDWWPDLKFGVLVDPAARFQRLMLAYNANACGWSIVDLALPCSDALLRIHSRCGEAVDQSGAVISNATVNVLNAKREQVLYSTKTNDFGDFALPPLKPGEYAVQLKYPNFVDSTAFIAIDPIATKSDKCDQILRMTMVVGGGCVNPQVVDVSKLLESR